MQRRSPDVRPRTQRTREPMTLKPSLVSPARMGLKTFLVNQPGCWKRGFASRAAESATGYHSTLGIRLFL